MNRMQVAERVAVQAGVVGRHPARLAADAQHDRAPLLLGEPAQRGHQGDAVRIRRCGGVRLLECPVGCAPDAVVRLGVVQAVVRQILPGIVIAGLVGEHAAVLRQRLQSVPHADQPP